MRTVSLVFATLLLFCATKAQNSGPCPTISVAGPAGITGPGENAGFAAQVEGYELKKLTFAWTVSFGKIVSGERAERIAVEVPHDLNEGLLKATVEISGLPEGCPSRTDTEAVVATGIMDVFPNDQFYEVMFEEEKARLDNLAIIVRNAPADMKGYIIKNFKKTSTDHDIKRKIERIKKFLFTYRKYPKERFVIIVQRSDMVSTSLWLWPSDGSIPPY